MLENLFNDILSNPAYLAVAIALAAMIAYSVIKRLYKLVVLAVVLFVIYCAYLTLTDQPLPDQAKELKEKASDTLDKANDTLDKLKN